MTMKLVEINDKDEKREKITFFVIHIEEELIKNLEHAIQKTWNMRDYTVADLKKKLIESVRPMEINFIYDCTDENQKGKVVEMAF